MVEKMGFDPGEEACCPLETNLLGVGVHWVKLGKGVVVARQVP